MATGLKKLPKRPIKQNYIDKYGFEGERIWRLDLLKYNEQKNAIEHYNEGLKEQARRAKEEERRTRELEQLNKSTSKSKTSKPAGKRTCKPKTVKVGDKIVGTVNGMVGVIKDVRQDTVNTSRGNRQTSPYAVIEVLNPKKGQQRIITTSLDNINRLENKGGIRVEKQKPKTAKPAPVAPAKNKPASPKTAKPAQTSPKTTSKPSEAKSYTVRQGRTCKTFATKAEAKAYKEQCKNKNVTITEGTKKPTHRVVNFTARK